jgi:ABC-type spermidine/putrescine transport system permease subunit II
MATPPEMQSPSGQSSEAQQRLIIVGAVIGAVVVVALAVVAIIAMARNPVATQTIRDIFIIVMALESLVIGAALIILIIQIAVLTNLLQHEIKPILESTNETVNTVRGTTAFLSENLVEPVVKLNSYVAALQSVLEGLRLFWPKN